jgi:hypothetical protein
VERIACYVNPPLSPLLENILKKGINSATKNHLSIYTSTTYNIGKGIVLVALAKTLIFTTDILL